MTAEELMALESDADILRRYPMLWSQRSYNHLFVMWRGKPIYKNYDSGEPSWLLNDGWPNSVRVL